MEYGLMPWVWLEYAPGYPAIFGDRTEGYLAPMVYSGDAQRLEADGTEALITMTQTHDGKLMKIHPGIRAPLSELRFKREDVEAMAAPSASKQAAAGAIKAEDVARARHGVTGKEIIEGFSLDGKDWDNLLSHPNSDGKRFKPALVQVGKQGKGGAALWSPIVFARLLIEQKELNKGQAASRFKKAWPQLEDEMLTEIGEI